MLISPYLLAFVLLIVAFSSFLLGRFSLEVERPLSFNLKQLLNAQVEGEERGLHQAYALLLNTTKFYGQSGILNSLAEELQKEIYLKQLLLQSRRPVERGISIPIQNKN